MKHLLIVFTALLLCNSCISQNSWSYLDTIFTTQNESSNFPHHQFLYSNFKNSIIYVDKKELQSNKIVFSTLDGHNNKIIATQKPKNAVRYASDFAINNNYLVIIGHGKLNIYRKSQSRENEFSFSYSLNTKKYRYISLDDSNMLFLHYEYNYYLDSDKAGYALLDIENKNWIIRKKQEIPGIYYTHLTPSNLISKVGKHIVFLNPVSYQLYLIGLDSIYKDSLSPHPRFKNPLPDSIQNFLSVNNFFLGGKDVLGILNKFIDTIDRCQQIIEISDTSFLVSYYLYNPLIGKKEYFLDFYHIVNHKLRLVKKRLSDQSLLPESSFIDSTFPAQHSFNAHLFTPNYLYILKTHSDFKYWKGKIEEIDDYNQIYFSKKNGVLAIYRYKLTL